jgi:hypothetical protein
MTSEAMMNEKTQGTALAVRAQDFLPVFDTGLAIERRNAITEFVKKLMIEDTDYGTIPGVNKPTLLKPGAEKLVTFFGLSPEFITTAEVEDWTGEAHKGEQFFYYRYKCRLTRDGRLIGEGEGSANSWEVKYRYRWVMEDQVPPRLDKSTLQKRDSSISEFDFAIDKAETTGPYGKPAEHWQRFRDAIAAKTALFGNKLTKSGKPLSAWTIPAIAYRVPNTEAADVVNTLQKMAQKRALVAAVLIGVNASEFFTQDVEDMDIIDVTPTKVEKGPAPTKGEPASKSENPTDAGKPLQSPEAHVGTNFREDEAILTIKEASNMVELTKNFNALPVESRRPGTECYKAFTARRDELTKKAKDPADDPSDKHPGRMGR